MKKIRYYISWIQDENDNPPQFNMSSISANVLENTPVRTFVSNFHVIDIDQGAAGLVANYSLNGTDAEK